MNRIDRCFAALSTTGTKALVPYITAGDPNPDFSASLLRVMVDAGANILELGVPFSDPMADGPVIQRATERALGHHMTLAKVLDIVQEFREHDDVTPIVLMGYTNPVETMGYGKFADRACEAGVDGVITVDLPPEEAEDYISLMGSKNIAPIFLVAPTTAPSRIETISAMAKGFIYYVSLKGVTGASHLDIGRVGDKLESIRSATKLPIGVGFGIRDAKSAAEVARFADAVVVGSAIVQEIEKHGEIGASQAVQHLLGSMRKAMDRLNV